jgi:hypothetical protein
MHCYLKASYTRSLRPHALVAEGRIHPWKEREREREERERRERERQRERRERERESKRAIERVA